MRVRERAVEVWLWSIFAMVVSMVVLGGITRLTGSGLSMVEWQPLRGVVFPLSEHAWMEVFLCYQESPQFQQVNPQMTLADFKSIFWWEYLHRLVGRLIGLVVVLPWIYFARRRRVPPWLCRRLVVALVLGGAQGLLGWLMVKSGLVDVPAVSPYRLAAHLCLALVIALYLLRTVYRWRLECSSSIRESSSHGSEHRVDGPAEAVSHRRTRWGVVALLGVTFTQVSVGAQMAGSRAGYLFQTFPDLNGAWLPGELVSAGTAGLDWWTHPVVIHWTHRALAAVVVSMVLLVGWWSWQLPPPAARRASVLMLVLLVVQVGTGVATVVLAVPVSLAVAHQGIAVAFLCTQYWLYMTIEPRRVGSTSWQALTTPVPPRQSVSFARSTRETSNDAIAFTPKEIRR